MRNLSTTKYLLLSSVLVVFLQQAALAQDHAAKIQEVLAVAHKYRQFNGAALVAENGKVVYKGAFGMANMEWAIPNTPEFLPIVDALSAAMSNVVTGGATIPEALDGAASQAARIIRRGG